MAAVVLAGLPAHAPRAGTPPRAGAGAAMLHRHRVGHGSPLIRLAADVIKAPAPAGNATLVARSTTAADRQTTTVYDLYTDNGGYYFSRTDSGLPAQVSGHDNQADGLFAREIAAAKLAATGSVQQAAQDMAARRAATSGAVSALALAPESGLNDGSIGVRFVFCPVEVAVWESA